MRILLVEDEKTLRAQLRAALSDAGYTVDEADKGVTPSFWVTPKRSTVWCWIWVCPWWTGLRCCSAGVMAGAACRC